MQLILMMPFWIVATWLSIWQSGMEKKVENCVYDCELVETFDIVLDLVNEYRKTMISRGSTFFMKIKVDQTKTAFGS